MAVFLFVFTILFCAIFGAQDYWPFMLGLLNFLLSYGVLILIVLAGAFIVATAKAK